MRNSQAFVAFTLEQLDGLGGVSARAMFGGHGLYRNGRMFALVADDVLYLKADDANRPLLEAQGGQPFKPFAHKTMVMPYIEVPVDLLEDADRLVELARTALAAAMAAPPPPKRRRAK